MGERLEAELALIRRFYPNMEYREDEGWIRLPVFQIPPNLWEQIVVEVAFEIPKGYPGTAPYGIYVKPGLRLKGSGQKPKNYQEPVPTPFGDGWGKFSWQIESWKPSNDLRFGTNLMDFIRTFKHRFEEGA